MVYALNAEEIMEGNKNEIVLEVKDLSVILADQKIIDNLSFRVKRGETLVILGPNGAGKTTLLRALLGIIPSKGEIYWHTKNISYLPPSELMQRRGVMPLTVNDFFKIKNVNDKQVYNSIESVGLERDCLNKRLSHLSTGQFQRLSIAWALVDEPDTLIFDEPTSGIDVGGAETIYSLLHKFWQEKALTILLVTHDLSIVWEHADNVLCLNKKNVCYGPPSRALTTKNLKDLYGVGVKYYLHNK